MSHWLLDEVITKWLSDGQNMELQTNLLFLDSQGEEWYVSKGSIIDGASIPEIAWSFVGSPFVGKYRRASIIHDAYCQSRGVSSAKVHNVFYEIMIVDGVHPFKAFLMWLAVRLFGPQFKVDQAMNKYPVKHTFTGFCIGWCLTLIMIDWTIADTPPEKAIITDAELVEWYDGDTAVVNVTTQYRVRLLDCWAPEVKGSEKEQGLKSKEYIKSLCPEGSTVRLKIPTTGRLQDSLTFGRVLGEIWSQSEDGEWHNVSDQMVKDGFATKTKER